MVKNYYPYLVIALSVFSINLTSFQTFAVEEIWEDYEKIGEMVKDIKNGDKDDDKVDYNKLKNSTVYKNASADIRTCIDLANKVGEKLGDYEIVHCFENTNYFKEKYVDDEDDPNMEQISQQEEENENMTQSNTLSDADRELQEEGQEQEQQEEDNKSTLSASNSDTITEHDVTGNSLIDELVKTGRFTEGEAKEFVSQNMLSRTEITSTIDNTTAKDTQANGTSEQNQERVVQNDTRLQVIANVSQTPSSESESNSIEGCDSSYPEICITTYSTKLTCTDIPFRNFKVLLPDPHVFDSDGDGIGCEE
jgi:polyhydroxyalkanoate synthesis regulator phasin